MCTTAALLDIFTLKFNTKHNCAYEYDIWTFIYPCCFVHNKVSVTVVNIRQSFVTISSKVDYPDFNKKKNTHTRKIQKNTQQQCTKCYLRSNLCCSVTSDLLPSFISPAGNFVSRWGHRTSLSSDLPPGVITVCQVHTVHLFENKQVFLFHLIFQYFFYDSLFYIPIFQWDYFVLLNFVAWITVFGI